MTWSVRQLAEARRLRRRVRLAVRADQRDALMKAFDSEMADAYIGAGGDPEVAEANFRTRLFEVREEYGLDPATILLLVRLAFLIFEAWKTLKVATPDARLFGAMFDGEDADE